MMPLDFDSYYYLGHKFNRSISKFTHQVTVSVVEVDKINYLMISHTRPTVATPPAVKMLQRVYRGSV